MLNSTIRSSQASAECALATLPLATRSWTRTRFFLVRCMVSMAVSVLKVFCGGFGWQAFAFLAQHLGQRNTSVVLFLFTGVGDALGAGLGACVYAIVDQYGPGGQRSSLFLKIELWGVLILCAACFCAGISWQPLVNVSVALKLPFVATMLLTGVGCAVAFFIGMVLARFIAQSYSILWRLSLLRDLTLAIAVCGADAVFVGTVKPYMSSADTWLQELLGESSVGCSATAFWVNCSKAGFSTMIGFLVLQMPLCVLMPHGYLWTDPWPTTLAVRGLCQEPSISASWLLQPDAASWLRQISKDSECSGAPDVRSLRHTDGDDA